MKLVVRRSVGSVEIPRCIHSCLCEFCGLVTSLCMAVTPVILMVKVVVGSFLLLNALCLLFSNEAGGPSVGYWILFKGGRIIDKRLYVFLVVCFVSDSCIVFEDCCIVKDLCGMFNSVKLSDISHLWLKKKLYTF